MARIVAVQVLSALLFSASQDLESKRVESFIVISSDPAIHRRFEDGFTVGSTIEKVKALAKGPRFQWGEWERNGVVLLDLEFGPGQEKKRANEIIAGAAKQFSEVRAKKVGDLQEPMKSNVKSYLNEFIGKRSDQDDSVWDGKAIGLNVGIRLFVSGPGKEAPLNMNIHVQDKKFKDSTSALRQNPMTPPLGQLTEKERDRRQSEFKQTNIRNHSFEIRALGFAKDRLAEAMLAAQKEIEIALKNLETERINATRDLLAALGLEGDFLNESIGTGEMNMSELPPGLRKEFESQLLAGYKAFGFGSEDEARAFLNGATSVRVRTNIGLRACENPDLIGSNGSSIPVFWIREIGSIGGYPGR
jgi:hypothetical protein